MNSLRASGEILDANRFEVLKVPIVSNNNIHGWIYVMPPSTEQSVIDKNSSFYKAGRVLAGAGIVTDAFEILSALVPESGTISGPLGVADAFITASSGFLTGDNYLPGTTPDNLPPMYAINQDLAINGAEATVGFLSPALLAVGGTTSGPAGAIIGETVGGIIDALTSGASALYDYGRFEGSLHNFYTVGFSEEGLAIVYWPYKE